MKYHISEDKNCKVLYIFRDIALIKVGTNCRLAKAHWLILPNYICYTGDMIDEEILSGIKEINALSDMGIVYGSFRDFYKYGDTVIYFIYHSGSVKYFKTMPEMDDYLLNLVKENIRLLEPDRFIGERVRNLKLEYPDLYKNVAVPAFQ